MSLILWGGYKELKSPIRDELNGPITNWLAHHRAPTINRVGLDKCHRIYEVDGPTWTLVLSGPIRREWGFYVKDEECRINWTRHDTYHNPSRTVYEGVNRR